jgi:Trk-type K+ transport system membrane component
MVEPRAVGERCIVAGRNYSMREVAAVLDAHLSPRGYRIPTRNLPSWVMRVLARFDKTLRLALNDLDVAQSVDSNKARRVLGFRPRPIEETIRHSLFQVVSIVTTTGYASIDFDLWSPAAKHLLFVGMFIGGMAGSTTCSIKALRWLVVIKAFRRDLFVATTPSAIRPVRLSGNVVDEETVRDIYAYTLVSLVFFILGTVFVVIDASRVRVAVTEFEAMSAVAATFFNVGPAFGIAGPLASYEPFPPTTKLALMLLMWVGRIEIIPVLVLLTPSFWRS